MLDLLLSASVTVRPVVVDGTLCHPHRLIVRREVANALEKNGVEVRHFNEIGFATVNLSGAPVETEYRRLRKLFGSDQVFLDRAALPAYTPSDPLFPNSWHHTAIRSELAWDLSLGSNQIVVAVIDTGFVTTNPDLQPNMWTNPGETAGNGLDDDGNGYVDDVVGYDFAYNDANPNEVVRHGTQCAGLVAAAADNGFGSCGVAPRARIMALKASNDDGYFYDSANIAAYLYAVDNGAKILSCSFYSDRVSEPEREALEYAWSQGVLPIVAAGNARTVLPYYPAAHDVCLSVGATNTGNNRASFSNFGMLVDVATPGVSLVTTYINGTQNNFAGTSGACPVAAGAAALVWGANPNLTNAEVRALLEDTAISSASNPLGDWTNYGRVDVRAAMEAAQNGVAPKSVVVRGASPFFYAKSGPRQVLGWTRVFGRGLSSASSLEVRQAGRTVPHRVLGRDLMEFAGLPGPGPVEIFSNGALVSTLSVPGRGPITIPMLQGSSPATSASGGFSSTLADDGVEMTVNSGTGTTCVLEGVFRVEKDLKGVRLEIDRRYTGGTAGTEKVSLYDWSTASYPYGSFRDVSELAVVNASGNLVLNLADFSDLVDVDGNVYLRINSTGVDPGTTLRLDSVRLVATR